MFPQGVVLIKHRIHLHYCMLFS